MKCVICHKTDISPHHIFYGKHRKLSERYGLVINLCINDHDACHPGKLGSDRYSILAGKSQKTIQRLLCANLKIDYDITNLALNTHTKPESREYLEKIAEKLKGER